MAALSQPESNKNSQSVFVSENGLLFSSFKLRKVREETRSDAVQPVAQTASAARMRTHKLYSPRDLEELLWPIHKHWPNESWEKNWSLYWMPYSFENRAHTKADPRFLHLFENLMEWTMQKREVRGFTFFDAQLTYPHLIEHFILNAIEYLPMLVMSFCPGKGPIGLPKYDEVTAVDFRAVYRKLTEKQQSFSVNDVFPGMARQQNFIFGDQDLARRNLMGRGGYTFYLSQHSQERFGDVAKEILAEFSNDPMLEQMPLVVPIFDARAFLTARIELLTIYFSLFDLYVGECPADNGILIAAAHNLDDPLVEFVKQAGYQDSKRRPTIWSKGGV